MQLLLELEQDTILPFPLHNMALATPSPTPTLLCAHICWPNLCSPNCSVPPSFTKKSTHHHHFLCYSWAVWRHSRPSWASTLHIVICVNPAFTKMIDRTEKPKNPSKFAKHTAWYNKFCCYGPIVIYLTTGIFFLRRTMTINDYKI